MDKNSQFCLGLKGKKLLFKYLLTFSVYSIFMNVTWRTEFLLHLELKGQMAATRIEHIEKKVFFQMLYFIDPFLEAEGNVAFFVGLNKYSFAERIVLDNQD